MDPSPLYEALGRLLPLDCLQARFMQRALLGLLLVAPMAAAMGVQVIHFRMAFFADAISHSAFAGVAFGLLLSLSPHWATPLFGVLTGITIMAMRRHSSLPSDTVVGVIFSAVMAFGLAVVSREPGVARDMQRFLYGDILTLGDRGLLALAALFAVVLVFQGLAYNRLLYLGLHPAMAQAHGVRVAAYQYGFSGLLSLVIMGSIWAAGVLLVTALLIVPAAAARNFARTAGSMFRWALLISATSAAAGLLVSAHDRVRTATGPTVVLAAFAWFLVSLPAGRRRAGR